MSEFWSKKVQSTELLYYSRDEKFNVGNKELWFDLLKVKDGMQILEVGCGGGLFTNRIKEFFPNCKVYGIDLDENHIAFAKEMAKSLGLEVDYQVADIKNLPFKDEQFDLVFSHTVVEHLPFDDFIAEQKRVLKKDGQLVIMKVDMVKKNDKPFMEFENEINEVFNKMQFEDNGAVVGQYGEDADCTMRRLDEHGFKDIDFRYERIIYYMPDTVSDKNEAKNQIERNYKTKLYNALFCLDKAKNGQELKQELLDLLKKQYEKRLQLFDAGTRLFDFQSSLLITVYAKK